MLLPLGCEVRAGALAESVPRPPYLIFSWRAQFFMVIGGKRGKGGGGWDVAARGIFLWALASSFPFNRLGLLDRAGVGEVISLHGRSLFLSQTVIGLCMFLFFPEFVN